MPHANAPNPVSIFLRSNHNQRLASRLTSPNALLFATPVCLVHFHHSGEAVPPRPHHGTPQFMQPSPRGVVAPQAQNPLEADSAGTVLLAGDCPHRPKPNRQRFACVLENCSGCHRTLIPATCTLPQQPTHRPVLPSATTRATKTIRPPQPHEIFPAGCLCRKARLKFGQISGIILHGRPYYILGLPESSRYPISSSLMVIKPLEEDSTPGTVKPFQVSLVEPVAYQFQLSGDRKSTRLNSSHLGISYA